jgi:hypothetical protein
MTQETTTITGQTPDWFLLATHASTRSGDCFLNKKKTSSSSKRDPYEAYQPVQSKQDASFVNREEITHANPPLLIA